MAPKGVNYPGQFVKMPFQDAKGHPFAGMLDIDGNPINDDDPDPGRLGCYFDGGDRPSFQRFRVYRELDFAELQIL
jgi:hypothetical protein